MKFLLYTDFEFLSRGPICKMYMDRAKSTVGEPRLSDVARQLTELLGREIWMLKQVEKKL